MTADKLDFYFNGQIREVDADENEETVKFIVDADNLHISQPLAICFASTLVTIDGIISSERTEFDFFNGLERHQTLLCPDPDVTRIKSTQFGYHDFGVSPRPVNQNQIPNMLFAISNGPHKFSTHIFFPEIYKSQQDPTTVDKSYRYGHLLEKDRRIFVDKVFLPSLRLSVHPAKVLRFTKDYEQALKKGYTTTSSLDFLKTSDLRATFALVRALVNDNPLYQRYSGYYFISYAFGGKQDLDEFMCSP